MVSRPYIKQVTAISLEPEPITFQDHLMTCLHNLNKLPFEIIHNTITLYIFLYLSMGLIICSHHQFIITVPVVLLAALGF